MSTQSNPQRQGKITVLFDIDGTLLLTGGAGVTAMKNSVRRLFGIGVYPELEYHGRTDFAIAQELFQKLGISFEQHFAHFRRDYHSQLQQELTLGNGHLLPGVTELLQRISADERFSLGLLTGNSREAADLKLSAYGIRHYFGFGGFGDFHSCRNDVAREAVRQASDCLGTIFDRRRLVVIGDTPADVACARAVNAMAVAVATGHLSSSDLARSNPDCLLESLVHLTPESLASWSY